MPDAAPTLDTPSVHPTYVRMLCMALQRQGVDVPALLSAADMPPWQTLAISDTYFDQRTLNRLIGCAMRASGRPWFGIEVGASVPISAHGPVGYAIVGSRSLRQALDTVSRFGVLRNANLRYQLRESQQGMTITLVERLDLGESRDFVMGLMFAILIRLIEAVVGHALPQLVVDLPFAEPKWLAEIQKIHAGTVRFRSRQLALHVDPATLDLPCITADPQAHAQACQVCEQQLARTVEEASLRQRVAELLHASEGDYPSLVEVAAYFSMSKRTLMRRLKDQGTSFQDLLDGARQQRALWYLNQTQYAVDEIASRMGYQDTSNFSRTFKRWFGVTPSAVRRGTWAPVNVQSTVTISKSTLA